MTRRHNQEKMNVLKRAIRHYGKRNQVQKAIEEMAELINELCKEQIGRISREKIAEEMADVIIMLWQLEMIFENGDEILQAIDYKLKRLHKRITKGDPKWK